MNINLSLLQSSVSQNRSHQAAAQSSSKTPSGQSPSTSAEVMQQPVYGSSFSGQQHRATGATPELEALLKELESFAKYDSINGGFILIADRKRSPFRIGDVYGGINVHGYRVGSLFRTHYLISRLVWLWHTGQFPSKRIDHLDRDRVNDRIENLRDVGAFENNKNGKLRNNKSGYTGIYWHKKANKWQAVVSVNYTTIYLGLHNTLEEAVAAREEAIKNNPQWGYSTSPETSVPNLKISIGKAK